mmetsp:Transcript_73796/g.130366  ORF Transcript_73796/g.130366 Transcript_73796/m.130366 type:complete len:175 (-) Transcript_73796:18-542(-)
MPRLLELHLAPEDCQPVPRSSRVVTEAALAERHVRGRALEAQSFFSQSHVPRKTSTFFPEVQLGSKDEAGHAMVEAQAANAEIKDMIDSVEEAEEYAGEAEKYEKILLGLVAFSSSLCFFVAGVTYHQYLRWLDLKRTQVRCVRAARVASEYPSEERASSSSVGAAGAAAGSGK